MKAAWISVKDELPEIIYDPEMDRPDRRWGQSENVLVYHVPLLSHMGAPTPYIGYYAIHDCSGGVKELEHYKQPRWISASTENELGRVMYWMPLPKDPQED